MLKYFGLQVVLVSCFGLRLVSGRRLELLEISQALLKLSISHFLLSPGSIGYWAYFLRAFSGPGPLMHVGYPIQLYSSGLPFKCCPSPMLLASVQIGTWSRTPGF